MKESKSEKNASDHRREPPAGRELSKEEAENPNAKVSQAIKSLLLIRTSDGPDSKGVKSPPSDG